MKAAVVVDVMVAAVQRWQQQTAGIAVCGGGTFVTLVGVVVGLAAEAAMVDSLLRGAGSQYDTH